MSGELEALLRSQKLIICVGSGGVGKTTTSASLALQAAMRGRRVLVLTIDPARRLANALGLEAFGNAEVRIDLDGLPVAEGGQLWAMMLDNTRTFDDLIARVSPDGRTRDRILGNRIYKIVAGTVAGSQDYMATEKLHDVVLSGRYDLVILDTPPVKNALDFLDAPGRLARFLDRRIMKWFLAPYDEERVFGKLIMGTSAVVFRLLGHMFGRAFLVELSEFFLHFRDLYDGFRQRHEAVVALFRDVGTSFLIVCAPTEPSVQVAGFFLDELQARQLRAVGVVVNQRHQAGAANVDVAAVLGGAAAAQSTDLAPHTADQLLARLGAAHRRLRELAQAEAARLGPVHQRLRGGLRRWDVPRLPHEVHDRPSLAAHGAHLFTADAADPPAV